MDLPINDDELQRIVHAMGVGGDAALYHKLKTVLEVRQSNPGGPYKRILREHYGIVV